MVEATVGLFGIPHLTPIDVKQHLSRSTRHTPTLMINLRWTPNYSTHAASPHHPSCDAACIIFFGKAKETSSLHLHHNTVYLNIGPLAICLQEYPPVCVLSSGPSDGQNLKQAVGEPVVAVGVKDENRFPAREVSTPDAWCGDTSNDTLCRYLDPSSQTLASRTSCGPKHRYVAPPRSCSRRYKSSGSRHTRLLAFQVNSGKIILAMSEAQDPVAASVCGACLAVEKGDEDGGGGLDTPEPTSAGWCCSRVEVIPTNLLPDGQIFNVMFVSVFE